MRRILFVLVAVMVAAPAFAKKSEKRAEKEEARGIFYTNGRMDFVRLEELKEKEAGQLALTQPATIDIDQMKRSLAAVMLSNNILFKRQPVIEPAYNDTAVEFLAPIIVKAFSQAKPNQEVLVSWLRKDPKIVIREDRITIARMRIKDGMLYIHFDKLLALLSGDYDRRGNFDFVVNNAKGLRLKLLPSDAVSVAGKDDVMVNMSAVGLASAPTGDAKVSEKAAEDRSVKNRLRDLDQLRKDRLITEAEYQEKRKAILGSL